MTSYIYVYCLVDTCWRTLLHYEEELHIIAPEIAVIESTFLSLYLCSYYTYYVYVCVCVCVRVRHQGQ